MELLKADGSDTKPEVVVRRFATEQVETVLERMGIPAPDVLKAYEALRDFRGRQRRAPTAEEIEAVKQFYADGDIAGLKTRLGTMDRTFINGLVTRVTGYLGAMTRKGSAGPPVRPKYLSETKLKVALEQLGYDVDAFLKTYDALPGRRHRIIKEPSAAELSAVEEFVRTGDSRILRDKLERKDRVYVNAVVTRVLAWKGAQRGANV